MTKKDTLLSLVVIGLMVPSVRGFIVLEFPGLDELVETADAIVVLRVVTPADVPSGGWQVGPYRTHNCHILQTLKGDIPAGEYTHLRLLDTWHAIVTPFARWSVHLVFLRRRSSSDLRHPSSCTCIRDGILVQPRGR